MFRDLKQDQQGSVAVESAFVILILLLATGGMFDSFVALNQFNSASKAVERGARLAAVSAPVDSRLSRVCVQAPCAGYQAGEALTGVEWTSTCSGATSTCSVTGANASLVTGVTGVGTYNAQAMNFIVNGRATTAGDPTAAAYGLGMRDMCCCLGAKPIGQACANPARDIQPANVTIIYRGSGLGFAGNPCGAVPSITVRITGLQFNFVWLRMIGLTNFTLPPITATTIGEDLWTNGSDPESNQCSPGA